MTMKRRAGFTMMEVIVVTGLAALFMALLLPPMLQGLAISMRERARLKMFQDGDMLMNNLNSVLQSAVVPIVTDPDAVANNRPVDLPGSPNFTEIINSQKGFWDLGREWRDALLAGTDFLPFCIPVEYKNTGSRLDSDMLPVLGIELPSGVTLVSANYTELNGGKEFHLASDNIHPDLSRFSPGMYSIGSGGDIDVASLVRFGQQLPFASDSNNAFAVIRFLPTLNSDGTPVLVKEQEIDFDLNESGDTTDSFALGSIQLVYASGGNVATVTRSLSPVGVLLQLNTGANSYTPLFQLVGGFGQDNSPSGAQWTGTTASTSTSYTILVRALLFDRYGQTSVLGFGTGRPYLAYKFQTFITLRNMALQ